MQDAASVCRPELILVPLAQVQPVLKMLTQITSGACLHPADASDDHLSVEGLCEAAPQDLRPVTGQGCPAQTAQCPAHFLIGHDLRTCMKAVQQGKVPHESLCVRKPSLDEGAQLIRQKAQAVRPACDPPDHGLLLGIFRLQGGEKSPQHGDQIGGPQAPAVSGHRGKRECQCPGRFCHIQIQIQSLRKHLLPGSRREHGARRRQELPVHIRQNASPGGTPGNTALIDARHKEVADLGQSGALDISHQNAVHPLGKCTQADLGKARLQKLQIIAGAHPLLPRQVIDLVHQIDHMAVDLAVLEFTDHIPGLPERIRQGFHPGLGPAAGKEIVQFPGADSRCPGAPGLFRGFWGFCGIRPAACRPTRKKADTEAGHRFHFPQESDPGLLAGGIKSHGPLFPAPDAVGKAIVLKPVRLVLRQGAQAAPQIAEDRRIGKVLRRDLQNTADPLDQDIVKSAAGPVYIDRDPCPLRFKREEVPVGFKICRDNGKVPVGTAGLRDHAPDSAENKPHLLLRRRGGKQLQALRCLPSLFLFKSLLGIPEQMSLQMREHTALPESGQNSCLLPHEISRSAPGFLLTGFFPTGFLPTGFLMTGFLPAVFLPAGEGQAGVQIFSPFQPLF